MTEIFALQRGSAARFLAQRCFSTPVVSPLVPRVARSTPWACRQPPARRAASRSVGTGVRAASVPCPPCRPAPAPGRGHRSSAPTSETGTSGAPAPMAADQRAGRDQPSDERVVAGVHRVLHRVRQDQQQHQAKGCVRPCLALACQAQKDQQKNAHHPAAQHKFPPENGQIPQALFPLRPAACRSALHSTEATEAPKKANRPPRLSDGQPGR